MKRIMVSLILTMMVFGAAYGAANSLSVTGAAPMLGDSRVITNLTCDICITTKS